MLITYKNQSTDLPQNQEDWTLQLRIEIFKNRVEGWQLNIADNMLNKGIPEMKHCGFAALSVMVSFFEMIAKYYYGFCDEGSSGYYWKQGLDLIYPNEYKDFEKKLIYKEVRSGLYHIGMTGQNIYLSGDASKGFNKNGRFLVINPHKLSKELQSYFNSYVKSIEMNPERQECFIQRFDYDMWRIQKE